jgi:hypothetical protein
MPRPDAKEWLTQALEDANTYDLPYVVRWPDGTYSAIDKRQLRECVGKFQAAASVGLVRRTLARGEQVTF